MQPGNGAKQANSLIYFAGKQGAQQRIFCWAESQKIAAGMTKSLLKTVPGRYQVDAKTHHFSAVSPAPN